MLKRQPRIDYSRAEVISDGIVHVAGLVMAVGGVPVLIVLAVLMNGGAAQVAAAAVYSATLVLMIVCSALYNMVPTRRWAGLLRRLDHSAIYLKIAGTFTPFAILTGAGVPLLGGIWGAALAGVGLKMASPTRFRWIGLALYLGMGWIGVAVGWTAFAALPPEVLILMAVGGGLYTVGVAFYLWDALPFHNTIWHIFVLAATLVFYVAVLVAVIVP